MSGGEIELKPQDNPGKEMGKEKGLLPSTRPLRVRVRVRVRLQESLVLARSGVRLWRPEEHREPDKKDLQNQATFSGLGPEAVEISKEQNFQQRCSRA